MIGLLKFIITLPLTLILFYWVFSNMGDITWAFSPLHEPLVVPFGYVIIGIFILGFLFGALLLWLNILPNTFKAWKLKSENKSYQKRLDRLSEESPNISPKALSKSE